jgi:hypothetical protein
MIISFLIGIFFLTVAFFVSKLKSGGNQETFFATDLTRFNKIAINLFILIASLTAIIQTNFQSIHLLAIPLFGLIMLKKKSKNFNYRITILELIIVFSFSFLLLFFAFGMPMEANEINVHYDVHFYAKLSQKIFEAKTEHFSALFSSYVPHNGISLYHYTDLWCTSLFAGVFNLSNLLVLCFFTYSLLLTLGIFTLKEFILEMGFQNSTLKTYLLILLIIFGFSLPINLIQGTFFEVSYSHFVYVPAFDIYSTKTLILLPLITLSIVYLIRKEYLIFLSFIFLSIITYSTTLIFFSSFLFFVLLYKLYNDIKRRAWNNRENYLILILVVGFYVSLALIIVNWIDFSVLPKNASILTLKSILILYLEYNFSAILVYCLPFLFIIFIQSKERQLIAIKFLILIFLSSSITSIYMIKYTDEPNSVQALINSAPFPYLILSFLIYTSLSKRYQIILSGLFIVCVIYNISNHTMFNGNFTKDEIKVQALLENKNSPKKWAVIDTSLTDNRYYKYNQFGLFLFYNNNLDYPVDFSNYFILTNEQLVKLPPINTGLLEQEFKYHPKESRETVFFNFIEKNGINYILSRNSKANELLGNTSLKENSFSLKYKNNDLMLWEVVRNKKI